MQRRSRRRERSGEVALMASLLLRKIISVTAAAAVAVSLFAAPVSASVRQASVTKPGNGISKDLDPTSNGLNIEDYYADYDSITFRSKSGGTIRLYLTGNSIGVDTDCASSIRVNVANEAGNIVATGAGTGSYEFDTGDDMTVNRVYYLMFNFTADSKLVRYSSIPVTKKADGDLTFVKSVCYDFNVDRCSELWTDPDSLQECLEPQNDVECDNPMVIAKANELTLGCRNDWEKVYAIYEYITENPMVELRRSAYVNDPFVIAQNDNMVSINTAIQLDLTGQVCSESIGTRQYSGTGGASDFAYGAIHSKGGRGIIAIASTAKGGTVSKIRPFLPYGSVVSISRNIVDYVITEYGIAKLRNRSIRQRAEALIQIAHPDFREDLRREAKKLMILL